MKKYYSAILLTSIITFSLTAMPVAAAYPAGSLLKGSKAEVFLVSQNNELRWIPDAATFNALGYDWEDIITVTDDELLAYSFGPTLKATEASTQVLPTVAESKAAVLEMFSDDLIMVKIAECESGFRQFNDDGTVLTSKNGLYIGVFQIDPKIHADYAKSLGWDVYALAGNLAYAKHLRAGSGYGPWPACSQKAVGLTMNLQQGDSNSQVKTAQQILNNAGFTLAESGLGSVGNETEYFGPLMLGAVQRFQCARGIVCSSSAQTNGYGLIGPRTRAALIDAALAD